jgi:hypothetical protein
VVDSWKSDGRRDVGGRRGGQLELISGGGVGVTVVERGQLALSSLSETPESSSSASFNQIKN